MERVLRTDARSVGRSRAAPRHLRGMLSLLLLGAMEACTPGAEHPARELTRLTTRPEDPDPASLEDQNDLMASASPDGSRVLFTSRRSGAFHLYVMDVDGSNVRRLTSGAGSQMQGSWSPDGERIVYFQTSDDDRALVVMNADGSEQKVLARSPGGWPVPSWSPDGTRVLYHAEGPDGSNDIWSVSADGGDARRLFGSASDDRQPVLSPDGRQIAFISRRDGSDFEVYRADASGASWVQLTNNDVDDFTPSWSPDGTRLVFQSGRGGKWTILTINADGSGETPITRYPMQYDPVWSADGSEIFFNSDRDGLRGIYVMYDDGSDQRKLTNTEPSSFVTVVRELGVDEAVRLFHEARAKNPGAVYFYEEEVRYLGQNYLEMGQIRRATSLFEVNVEAYPDSKAAYVDLANARLASRNLDQAITAYRRALEIDPEDQQIEVLVGRLQARQRLAP
ncbi:MAG: DPP IV N-terminal domain-containing protein [Gemmatimonadales bacterium]